MNEHHHSHQKHELPEGKLALFWILGALALTAGSWIVGHIEWALGTTPVSYYGAMAVGFLLILFGGLAWIGVSVGVAQNK